MTCSDAGAKGSRRSETGLGEIGSGELARVHCGHETRATRADIGYCFAAALIATPVSVALAGPLIPNEPDGSRRLAGSGRERSSMPPFQALSDVV